MRAVHILLNMLMLWFFGSELESLWGRRAFLRYFAVTGIGAALVYVLFMPLIDPRSAQIPLVGASGAVYGVLTAYAVLYPRRKVLLYFLIPVPVRWLVLGYIALEMMMMWKTDGVGHLAQEAGFQVFEVLLLHLALRLSCVDRRPPRLVPGTAPRPLKPRQRA